MQYRHQCECISSNCSSYFNYWIISRDFRKNFAWLKGFGSTKEKNIAWTGKKKDFLKKFTTLRKKISHERKVLGPLRKKISHEQKNLKIFRGVLRLFEKKYCVNRKKKTFWKNFTTQRKKILREQKNLKNQRGFFETFWKKISRERKRKRLFEKILRHNGKKYRIKKKIYAFWKKF